MLAVLSCRGRVATATLRVVKNNVAVSGSCKCYLSGISRMIDLPGATTSLNKSRTPNKSKNSKIQGVAFDFEVLINNIQNEGDTVEEDPATSSTASGGIEPNKVQPDVSKVSEVASLLNVDLNNQDRNKKPLSQHQEDDDLSLLEEQIAPPEEPKPQKRKPSKTPASSPPLGSDIRAKYAAKLQKKGVDGGLSGVDRAKNQVEDVGARGDAAGHLVARKIAAGQGQKGSTRWMSLTGTGKLLQTFTHRSLKIALVPRPKKSPRSDPHGLNDDRSHGQLMEDLKNQLKDVEFNVLVEQRSEDSQEAVKGMVQAAIDGLALDPNVVLYVSDQDASLRAAKDLGMLTCRIRPLNARRGNVSAHYTVKDVKDVQIVVDDMNGVSFNAVLNL